MTNPMERREMGEQGGNANPVNEQEWREIKRLTDLPLNRQELIDLTGRSWGVVHRVKRSKSFDHYKEALDILAERARNKRLAELTAQREDTDARQ